LTTSNETYFPAVVTFATELFAPNLNTTKGGANVTRTTGENFPGDVIEYTVTVNNSGQDSANNVVLRDVIPANTTYVPGSLRITSGANTGVKTDVAGDDQAEFDAPNNRVVFRLGTGANAASGGSLAPNAATTITFRVQINPNTPPGTVISNQANVTAVAATLNQPLTQNSNTADFTVNSPFADLSLSKTANPPNPGVGTNVVYTVTLSNAGPQQATGITVQDQLPAGVTFVSANASQGTFNPGTGVWTVGALAANGSAVLQITAMVNSFGPLTNRAQVLTSNQPDPDSTPASPRRRTLPICASLKPLTMPRPTLARTSPSPSPRPTSAPTRRPT
jgi:large repetitive protein